VKEVIMPKFGFTQEESEIVEWAVKEGDTVEQGDVLAVVTTDKVIMEVEAPESGVVAGLQYEAGDVVPVTKIIAYVLKPGESLPDNLRTPSQDQAAAVETISPQPEAASTISNMTILPSTLTPVAARIAADQGLDASKITGSGPGGRITRADVERFATQTAGNGNGKVRATPAAKRLARENGIELELIQGSGPNHRVQEADVSDFVGEQLSAVKPFSETMSLSQGGTIRTIPYAGMRKTIAANMTRSAQTIPHIQLEIDVDMESAFSLHEQAKARANDRKVSLTALIVKAVAWALRRNPMLNSQLGENEIFLLPDINIGVAVAIEDGLIVPVVHHADQKGILELAEDIHDMSARARQNKLRTGDLEGGTFTISNLGMFGIDRFTAIINPPQVGILAVSAAKKQFVPNELGEPILHNIMNMRLSADHRVVDGVVAARFLSDLHEGLENPEEMLL
jgi:pyruvate dehydrogenase E2 component (dihydrolipoamide acetyltransferase)